MSDSKNIDFDGIDEFTKDAEEPAVAPISIEDLLGSCSSDKEVEVAVDHNKQDVLEQFIKDKGYSKRTQVKPSPTLSH